MALRVVHSEHRGRGGGFGAPYTFSSEDEDMMKNDTLVFLATLLSHHVFASALATILVRHFFLFHQLHYYLHPLLFTF